MLLAALGRTLPRFPDLVSVIAQDGIHRYRDIDIAFAARSPTGELHAPVVRRVDRLSVAEIARECARLAKRAMRGKLDARDVGGACFTVSLIATPNVESFVALPPPLQSAILSLGATRAGARGDRVRSGRPPGRHRDGHLRPRAVRRRAVAEFCAALDRALNPEPA